MARQAAGQRRTHTLMVGALAVPVLLLGQSVTAGAASGGKTAQPAAQAPLTAAMAAQLSTNVNQHVIVIMKDQVAAAPVGTAAQAVRSNAIVRTQAPLRAELQAVHARGVEDYTVVNALAATVSAGEVKRLKANPGVKEVIPDVMIKGAMPATAAPATAGGGAQTQPDALTLNTIPGACGANGSVQLDPEGLSLTHTDAVTANAVTARSLGFTGAGVKVAYLADGIDPENVNFIRPGTSTSAFVDAQDFSGDGSGAATSGDEAFLDANTIAGQGAHVYNVQNFGAQADPSACNIRIEGVAPGASLVGLDVFGQQEDQVESSFLEAINYAVTADHVNVINESFDANPFPDVSALDAAVQFDDAAVAAGVVVTVSTGDGGSTNTIGSPASDPNVISVGASTDFRFYAQTNYAAARYFAKGWLDDNISALSSDGTDEQGGTVDLVAPGDLSFASCDANANFSGCVNLQGQPSDVEESGGTSEAAPFVAGAAALVIQAYRKTHAGVTPTPAQVKQILLSSTTSLGAPASEQGAGLLNTAKAVKLAESVGSTKKVGSGVLLSTSQLNASSAAGTANSWSVKVTNESSHNEQIHLAGKTVGPDQNVQTGSVTLADASSPQFANYQGLSNNYGTFSFTVKAHQQRLDGSIAYPGNPGNGNNARVRLILIDPEGRLAAHSLPQGVGNFGNVDVINPKAGKWEGVIFGDTAAVGGTNGVVPWRMATEQFVSFGSVTPASFSLPPGQNKKVTVTADSPATPGDSSGSIVVNYGPVTTKATSIAVTTRSLVPVGPGDSGAFNGALTGGNGRGPNEGQVDYYAFQVGSGHQSITANVTLADEDSDMVGAYLVSPDGDVLGYGENYLASGVNSSGSLQFTAEPSLTAFTLDPVAGTWTLVIDFSGAVAGDEVSEPFSGDITLDDTLASASGLPDSSSTRLASGAPITVPVSITNNGASPSDFFIDPRLDSNTTVALAPFSNASGIALPLVGAAPEWLVPTHTSALTVTAGATLPIMFDFQPFAGDPDLASAGPGSSALCSTTENGSYTPTGGTVTAGFWNARPSECGPYGSPPPAGSANMAMSATTLAFDPAVTSGPGDLWALAVNPSAPFGLFTINPGQTATVNVTITPSGAAGTVVHGDLYVDTFLGDVAPYGQQTGDELAALPYEYTVG